jgi:DNA-directed RNA polymerase subunit RPC12/RpoP
VTDEFTDDERARESELTEPRCHLCGSTVWLPWDIHSEVRCENCGARLKFPPHLEIVDIPKLQATIRVREERL